MTVEAMRRAYRAFQDQGEQLDLSRGKPSPEQLALSRPMLAMADMDYTLEDGSDARNYGHPTGIPEARLLIGQLLGAPMAQVIAGGNSSLGMLHDVLTRARLLGPLPGDAPWPKGTRILCPVPGYDWHFHMLDMLGYTCVPVPTLPDGPDMDAVETLSRDPSVKGLIAVPMYGNPSGITYSDAVVERLACMQPAASDFRIFWDNAYPVHHLHSDRRDQLKNLLQACEQAGCADRAIMLTSFSKITYPGGGMAGLAASARNIAYQSELALYQHVCFDSMSQLRHVRFLPDIAAVEAHMQRHADILRPKFDIVQQALQSELGELARWSTPLGGYFVCFEAPQGCARRTVQLCREAGVTLTPAGAPFPFGIDPQDSVIRLAPSFPSLAEIERVMALFPLAVKLAAAEKGLL